MSHGRSISEKSSSGRHWFAILLALLLVVPPAMLVIGRHKAKGWSPFREGADAELFAATLIAEGPVAALRLLRIRTDCILRSCN